MKKAVKLLVAIFVGIVLIGCDGIANKEEVIEEVKVSEVIFEYGSKELLRDKLPEEFKEYTKVRLPAIDTMAVQSALYDIETEQGIKELRIIIEDTQAPSIIAPNEITVKSKKDINGSIKATDPIDGELPVKIVGLDNLVDGDNELIIKATDKNGNTTEKAILVRYIMPELKKITFVNLEGKRERLDTRAITLGDLLDEINKDEVKYVLDVDNGNRYIKTIKDYGLVAGELVVFDSDTNSQCSGESLCPGIDKIELTDGDVFTFTKLNP